MSRFLMGLGYGLALGMAITGVLDALEAAAGYKRPSTPARVVTLTGRKPA